MPRIGPISDFYGAIIPPDTTSCTGLISIPSRSLHFARSDVYTSAGLEQTLVQAQLSAGTISETDAYVVSDAFQVAAGLAGYYRLTFAFKPQIATTGGITLSISTEIRVNNVLFASDLMNIGTPGFGNVFPQYLIQIPIMGPLAVGDKVTLFGRGNETGHCIWSGMNRAGATGSDTFAEFYFLGS
jgi:hypothetical protein